MTTFDEVRRQVLRRVRYATNTLSLQAHALPPEGPFDTALTNGLLAIVGEEWPSDVYDKQGRTHSASSLLTTVETKGPLAWRIDVPILREGLSLTQPTRHGLADDEFAGINESHIRGLVQLDEHPALRFLSIANEARSVDDCIWRAFSERAAEALPVDPKDRLEVPDPEDCDRCWRPTFLPSGWDMFGGTDSAGTCIACGFARSAGDAQERAFDRALQRHMEEDDWTPAPDGG